MSVTNVALAWAGSNGSETKQGREFTTTYRVETDTHLDQTKTIALHDLLETAPVVLQFADYS